MAESREGDAVTALGTFLNKESCVGPGRGDKCISYIYKASYWTLSIEF